ncbi:hypothetical protein AWJ20_4609 [Sugiyamaella lignohabitans]|uniref:WKF domain-containing protein n=1 Tax=Sugiyamaella lignohabitans TaxID=796027 RepID=A0A167E5J6_9ASCO|nr:uncharacterized protein AWJ20_4609 [Sugiyamaella lignohabitans]ANB13666.1 hypothetical protein AWJ20_4609 [Sugiyamaella lignohabitans]
MPEEFVPAWKKLGLKVKQTDPLAVGIVGTEQNENVKRKRKEPKQETDANAEKGPKKPPKRVKLPKNERPPPPEADQLAYLRQYHEDKENWKFSKQKQNWILKNLYTIEESYAEALDSYVDGLVGGARDRVVEEARKVISEWNEFMTKEDEEEKEKEESTSKEVAEKEEKIEESNAESSKSETSENSKPKSKTQEPPQPVAPSESKAIKARHFLELLVGEKPKLEFID